MEMVRVSSSNLISVGYDEATKILIIKFHNGSYKYLKVPKNIYLKLMDATSKGTYFHNHIKNQFITSRLD